MESAIPTHLECPRSRQRRVADDYVPPYPAFVARQNPATVRVVMAYFGIQSQDVRATAKPISELLQSFAAADGPGHWDRAGWIDQRGYRNTQFAAYWDQPEAFKAWFPAHGLAWSRVERPEVGTFSEILQPHVERYETVLGHPSAKEGIAVLSDSISGAVLEHAYWGAARDRIPASQNDALHTTEHPQLRRDGKHVTALAQDNICLIRSGQDWRDTRDAERQMYLRDMQPVLHRGMDFLRDEGRQVGCYSNRYVTLETQDGQPTEKSYGMSWWKNLASLERWAESHPTHLAIFGAATNYFMTIGPDAKLKLYHEVTISRRDEQFFEYLNCHDDTGLLRSAAS